MRALSLALSCLLCTAGVSSAQSTAPVGDPAAGEKIAIHGVGNTVVACNFCHGNDGQGAQIKDIPHLSGLGGYYISKQINDYGSGARARHPVMEEVVKEMTAQQIADVVAYFGTFELELPTPPEDVDADLVARGEQIAEFGDPDNRIQACSNCHGPRGIGQLPAIPPLVGQSARYITEQIRSWQKGDRKNDGGGQMRSVAVRMSDETTAAVAAYYAQARPGQPSE